MRIIIEQHKKTRNKIYKYIYYSSSPVTKSQIAHALNCSLPTVHKNLSELIRAGLIAAGDLQKSTGGRPPVSYVAVPDSGYALGIAVTANHLRFLLMDIKQNQISYKRIVMTSINSSDMHQKLRKSQTNLLQKVKYIPPK